MHATQLLVALLCELALHPDHSLEAGVKVGDAEIQELRELGDELLVHHVEYLLRVVVFLLCLGEWHKIFPTCGQPVTGKEPCGGRRRTFGSFVGSSLGF